MNVTKTIFELIESSHQIEVKEIGVQQSKDNVTDWDIGACLKAGNADIFNDMSIFSRLKVREGCYENFKLLYESGLFEMYMLSAAHPYAMPYKFDFDEFKRLAKEDGIENIHVSSEFFMKYKDMKIKDTSSELNEKIITDIITEIKNVAFTLLAFRTSNIASVFSLNSQSNVRYTL